MAFTGGVFGLTGGVFEIFGQMDSKKCKKFLKLIFKINIFCKKVGQLSTRHFRRKNIPSYGGEEKGI